MNSRKLKKATWVVHLGDFSSVWRPFGLWNLRVFNVAAIRIQRYKRKWAFIDLMVSDCNI